MSRREFDGRVDQRKAAYKRLRDAEALLNRLPDAGWAQKKGRHTRGAMYLAGYAIECRIKSTAMEVHRCQNLRELASKTGVSDQEIYSHGLEVLLNFLPGSDRFRGSPVWPDFASQVNRWRPSWRYDPADQTNAAAAAFLDAVHHVYVWLGKNW